MIEFILRVALRTLTDRLCAKSIDYGTLLRDKRALAERGAASFLRSP